MFETGFAKSSIGIFMLRAGMAVAELIGILYVTRSVGASTFGIYALFTAIVLLATLFTDLGISEATQKRISEKLYDSGRPNNRSRDQYFTASLLMRSSLFVVVFIVMSIFYNPIQNYIGSDIVFPFIIVGTLIVIVHESFSAVLAGEKQVARSVSISFVDDVVRVIIWIFSLILGYGLLGLLYGFLAGQLSALFFAMSLHRFKVRKPSKEHFRSLFRFAKYSWLASIKETSWVWTDTLILGVFVTTTFVGIYEVSWQISAVFFFVGSAVSTTLLPSVSELWTNSQKHRIEDLVESALRYTGIMAIPGFIGAIIIGEQILYFFGEEFTAGYTVLFILVFARLIHSYEIILEKLVHALDRPNLMFRANIIFIVLTVLLNFLFISLIDWWAAAVATSLSMLIKTVIVYIYASQLIDIHFPKMDILCQGISATIMGIGLLLFPLSIENIYQLIIIVGIGAIIYVSSLLVLSHHIRQDILGFFSQHI